MLRAGEKMGFAAGKDHRLANQGQGVCRFVLIHGVGKFDFVAKK